MPVRIAYISDRPFPSFWTDTQQVMKNAEGLALAGADVSLIIPRAYRTALHSARHRHQALRAHYRISPALRLMDVLTVPHTAMRFEKWPHAVVADLHAAAAGYDLVYSRNLLPAWLAGTRGRRVVYESHRRLDRTNGLKFRVLMDLVRRHELVGIITNSEFVRESFLGAGIVADRVLASKLGHDPRDFQTRLTRTEARQALGLDPARPLVVYTGHVDPTKGIDCLLALAEVLPYVDFLLVGGSKVQSTALGARARLRGLTNLSTRRSVSPDAVVPYLFASDILVNPPSSTLLAFPHTITPLKLYSYLAAGRPIIAGHTPDVAELLTHDVNALLCRPDDLQSAAGMVARLLGTPELGRRLAEEALKTSRHYTWEIRGQRILRFIQTRIEAEGT